MTESLTEAPGGGRTFLDFPFAPDPNAIHGGFAVLGVPFGMPYSAEAAPNDQSRAPDALRRVSGSEDIRYTREHYDFDLDGYLLDGRDIAVVDCGNVTAVTNDPAEHYRRAERAARGIYAAGATLIGIGGDHGITIPLLRALEELGREVTLVHVDAHLDWRDEINGEPNGYSSPIRRASEMDWIGSIVQVGMRAIGSARMKEVEAARAYGAEIVTAYELHDKGIAHVLERVPDGGPYYLTIDADGVDPALMPGVIAPAPGGLDWFQLHELVHGLVRKGPVLGMDLVEIAPSCDVRDLTLLTAERLICNFIGASIRAGHSARS
ncbi:MAG: agmatinase [Woeseiaceae bacterium]|nr:agmatinase [Woeseiaceae bacterium]